MEHACDLGYIQKPLPDTSTIHCHRFTLRALGHVIAAMCAVAAHVCHGIIKHLGLKELSPLKLLFTASISAQLQFIGLNEVHNK